MESELGANVSQLLAAIGPAIGPCCYRVDGEVFREFKKFSWAEKVFHPLKGGSYLLDLPRANYYQLREAGVKEENIFLAPLCTSCHCQNFFSYRAGGGVVTGRQAALLCWRGK